MFKKIIIWGHKYHSHTHSYIHGGYYRAFKFLGYDVLWLDNSDNIDDYNFENCLFITEGNVEKNIPIIKNSKYLVAYADRQNKILSRYNHNNLITLSSRQFDENENHVSEDPSTSKLDSFSYLRNNNYSKVKPEARWYKNSKYTLFQPWATDLLPPEVIKIEKKNNNNLDKIYHIGTIHSNYDDYFAGYIDSIKKNKKKFVSKTSSKHSRFKRCIDSFFFRIIDMFRYIKKDIDRNISLIQKSYVNAALQPNIQIDGKKRGYIPCRIFKNLSYGRLCGTNSKYVNSLFYDNLPFSESTSELFYNIEKSEKNIKFDTIEFLYNFIKDKHTYVNRAKNIIKAFSA